MAVGGGSVPVVLSGVATASRNAHFLCSCVPKDPHLVGSTISNNSCFVFSLFSLKYKFTSFIFQENVYQIPILNGLSFNLLSENSVPRKEQPAQLEAQHTWTRVSLHTAIASDEQQKCFLHAFHSAT